MEFVSKMPSLFWSSFQTRSSSVVLSDPSAFVSSSSSTKLEETPKSVLEGGYSGGRSEISPEDVQCDFAEVFRVMDKDGDGKIPAVELEAFFRRLGSTPPTEEEAAMMVSLVDTDGDGYITMEEFCALGGGATTTGTAELVEAFGVFDVNGDGRISAEELHSMLAALGHHGYTLDDCRKMIRSIDSDGDGFVGFEEFERMMSKSCSVSA